MNRRELIASMGAATAASFLPGGQLLRAQESATASVAAPSGAKEVSTSRDVKNGSVIIRNGYCDQPYVVITKDGNWLCVTTTGRGTEGEKGQHIVANISSNQGITWSPPIDIEPATGPEASWVMPYMIPSGRVYVFYTYNAEDIRQIPNCNSPLVSLRVDSLGEYAFKYSDDHGRTWSKERFSIPVRTMSIDRTNNFRGKTLQFWGVGKPLTQKDAMIFGFTKVGEQGTPGGFVVTQGVFMRSENIRAEPDPQRILWATLPDGEEGQRAPKGPVAEEINATTLSDGSLYCMYRTIDGYTCHGYSHDGGHTWTPREYATYSPGGRRIKHPRAAPFVRRFSNGKYLLWYHNHGGEAALAEEDWQYYKGRNPGWVAGGIEKNGHVYWSEPEVLLYDDDPEAGISYPDFIEDNGRFYITETQKSVARVHQIDHSLLEGAWNQATNQQLTTKGLLLTARGIQVAKGSIVSLPRFELLSKSSGVTVELSVKFRDLNSDQILLTSQEGGRGIEIATSHRSTLLLTLNDGNKTFSWDSDPGTAPGSLKVGEWQHIAIIIDSGPRIVSFVINGQFNDGGEVRDYGWARYPSGLDDINGASLARVAPVLHGELRLLRIYGRHLRTSEAVGNYRAETRS